METGVVLGGRYQLARKLGQGGMGEVWQGRDLRLGREIAVKVLRDAVPDAEARQRFKREAMLAADLQHHGITVVHDAGEHDGRMFIVMEMLAGQHLGAVIATSPGRLPVQRVIGLGIQVADVLAYAHGKGIVHRDIKPSNIIIQDGDQVKVCDFGLARDLSAATRVTMTGQFFGTPAYMAPEQWSGSAAEGADLYALGCILYEMLTGEPPFSGPTAQALMFQHLTQPPDAPGDRVPGVPPVLDDLVVSLLAKDQAGRPADARAVQGRLVQAWEELTRSAPGGFSGDGGFTGDCAPGFPEDGFLEFLGDDAREDRLSAQARSELAVLPAALASTVGRLLVGAELESDAERAYRCAAAARRLASDVGIVREVAGIAAYRTERWAQAIEDLNAGRRMTGRLDYLAVIADCQRALGRLDRALQITRSPEARRLPQGSRIELLIVESGILRDQHRPDAAVLALQVPELRSTDSHPWSARLFYAYAEALLAAGHTDEALRAFTTSAAHDPDGETDAVDRIRELTGDTITIHWRE